MFNFWEIRTTDSDKDHCASLVQNKRIFTLHVSVELLLSLIVATCLSEQCWCSRYKKPISALGLEVLIAVFMKISVFWDITACIFVENQPAFRRKNSPPSSAEQAEILTCFTLVFCVAFSSILKKEATHSSETSVDFQRTTRRCIRIWNSLILTFFCLLLSWIRLTLCFGVWFRRKAFQWVSGEVTQQILCCYSDT
jgi:hypothetical protein